MFLLDTDTIIYSLKGVKEVKENLHIHINDPMYISVITLMELYYGAYKSQKPVTNIAKIKTIEQTFEIIPVKSELIEIFAMLKSKLELEGTRLDDFDLIIASSALASNLTLITNNIKHFSRIDGLKLKNWMLVEKQPEVGNNS